MAKGYNYGILVGVDLDVKGSQIQKQLDEYTKGKNIKISTEIEGTEKVEKLKEASDRAVESAENLGLSYHVASQILNKSIEAIGAMVEEVYKLDDALVEFQKVSDLSGGSLDKYVDGLSEVRDSVARTTVELLQGATEFRKSGFNDEDAAILSVVSAKLQNVADEELSAGTAAEFLVSQIQAFNFEASDAEHIVDAVNKV